MFRKQKLYKQANDIQDAIDFEAPNTPQGESAKASDKPISPPAQRSWRLRLPRFQDQSQKKAMNNIFRFMALLLVFTLIARGTEGAKLAEVDIASPYQSVIAVTVTADGLVKAASSASIVIPSGLTVQEVLVLPGQLVKAGDAIARLDTKEVAEGLARAELAVDEIKLNLQKLERGEAYDSSALTNAQNTLTWARQDYNNTKTEGDSAVTDAQTALTNAQNTLTALKNTPPATASDVINLDDSAEAPAAAEPNPIDIAAAEAAVATAQTELEDAIRDADTALKASARSVETAKINLAAAQQADAEARQAAEDTAAQNKLDAEGLRLDIEKQQDVIAAYSAIQDGTVTTQSEGIVMELIEKGAVSGENALALISSTSGGYLAYADIPESEADKLQSGMQIKVSTQQGYYSIASQTTATLLSISSPNSESIVQITVRLPEGEWKHGQAVQMNAVISSQQYQNCVPLSALAQEPSGYFVYVMEQHSGVLGVENVVRAVSVTLLAEDGSTCAVEGWLYSETRVIIRSSKALADGDKVRVRQP